MAEFGNLMGGFLKGFTQARERAEQQKQDKKLRQAQLTLLEEQIKQSQAQSRLAEQQTGAREQLMDITEGAQRLPGTGVKLLDPTAQPPGLLDLLADPQQAMTLLQSGLVSGKDLLSEQRLGGQQESLQRFMEQFSGGQPEGPGGMVPAGVDFDPSRGPSFQFKPREVWQEVPSPDGMSMIQMDRQGQPIGSRPIGPGEQKLPPQRTGQEAADRAFAQEFSQWQLAGGFADVQKGLDQLREAKKELERGGISGPVIGNTPDTLLAVTNPRAVNTRELIEEVVQRNLRTVLGAQFTEREGERLIERAFNRRLPDSVNATRLSRLMEQIEAMAKAKQESADYFARHGTMEGFKGQTKFSIQDLEDEQSQAPKGIPKGSVQIGTSQGKPVWQSPDGRRWIED